MNSRITLRNNTITGYLISFSIGILFGFREFPEVIAVIYLIVAAVCFYMAFQNNIADLLSIIPYLIYSEIYMRAFVHSIPYLFMPYFLIAIFFVLILNNRSGIKLHSRNFILFFLFIVIEFVGSFRSVSADITRGLLTNSLVLFFVAMWSSFNIITPALANRILNNVKYAGIYLCGIVAARYLHGNVEFSSHSGSEGTNGLAPVQISGYIGFACAVFFFAIMNEQKGKNLITNIFLLCICSVVMLVSFSRGGVYFMAIIMVLYFLFNRDQLKSYFLFILLIPAGLFVYDYVSEKTNGLLEQRYEEEGSSGRDKLIAAGWALFITQPLVGVGPGNFANEITKNDLYEVESGAHNEFIRVAAEDGILGIITYWGFFILSFIQIFRRKKIQREYGIYFLVFFCMIIVHNGLKISIQPFLLMLAIATPGITIIKKRNMFLLKRSLQCDITQISKCHHVCFENSFSNKLGLPFISKTFDWFLSGENKFLYHVQYDKDIVGYIGGFCPEYNGDGSTSGMMMYAKQEAITGVLKRPWLLFSKELQLFYPLIFKNFYHYLFKKNNTNKSGDKINVDLFEKRIGVVVVGVHPEYRGKGVFEMLMNQFEKEATLFGITNAILSVKKENSRAINAYKKMGWLITKEKNNAIEMHKTISNIVV